jgi:hypothetical protein
MENKKLQDMTVIELKAYLFDLQGHVEIVRQVLSAKLQSQPVEEAKKE